MLLVIDVGNTHMVLGVYNGSQLLKDWRVHTERSTTEDEFNVLINSLFSVDNIDPHDVDQTYISCVVPPMVTILDAFCQKYLGHAPQWVDARNCAGMPECPSS
jgi:type III pantothenate kinase